MDLRHLCIVFFSPTGTTKKVVQHLGEKINFELTDKYDLTYPSFNTALEFNENDFVIFCYPVYSGRVPELMMSRMETLKGNDTPAAIVCTYGCREYDDALIEMKDTIESRGFKTIGAMAVVTEHSVVPSVGAGRPDANDNNVIDTFADEVLKKLLSTEGIIQFPNLYVPGSHKYRKYIHIPMAPKTTADCKKCGACIKLCPSRAISLKDKIVTDKSLCFGCLKCVKVCPQNARTIGIFKNFAAKLFLETTSTNKPSELFV